MGRVAGGPIVSSVLTRAPVFALTVDDGPSPDTTPALLDVLAKHGATATFFVVGERAERHPSLLRRIVAEGHELANHLLRDEPSIRLSAAEFDRQLEHVHRLLSAHGQVRFFRPGSGWFTPRMVRAGSRLGYTCALATPGLAVAGYPDGDRVAARLAGRCRAGDVVVLHEGTPGRTAVARVADRMLARLHGQGLRATRLTELVTSAG